MIIDGNCTIDYVKVNYILGSIMFSIIFDGFLAINHLLCIIDCVTPSGERGSVLDVLLSM